MLNLMMFLALSPLSVPQQQSAGPFQPCVWPKCSKPEAVVAEIQPCIWPKCYKTGTELVSFSVEL